MLVYKFEVVFLFLFFQTGTSADNYCSCDHSDLSQQFLFGSNRGGKMAASKHRLSEPRRYSDELMRQDDFYAYFSFSCDFSHSAFFLLVCSESGAIFV